MQAMWAYFAERLDTRWRAVLGALSLHAVVYSVVLSTPFKPEPTDIRVVPVVLVERSSKIVEEEVSPPIEVPDEAEEESSELDDAPETIEEPPPEEPPEADVPQTAAIVADPVRPPAPAVEPSLRDTDEEDVILIDPRYEIPFDSFAETAPSAMSRVIIATTCARASRTTRPDYCPEISIEDRYFSVSARPSVETVLEAYDPIFDIVATQSVIEGWFAGQPKHGTRSGSPELEGLVDPNIANHAEGLKNCTPVQTGLEGPTGIPSGLELRLGSSDGIQCR